MNKKRHKYNNFLNKVIIFTSVFAMLSLLFLKAQVSTVNIENERLKKKVLKQEKVNESLTMKVNELVSLENMQLVALKSGLEYNNSNIVVIGK